MVKIELKDENSIPYIGYIMNETNESWQILLDGFNQTIFIPKLQYNFTHLHIHNYDREIIRYDIPKKIPGTQLTVSEYEPIRIKICTNNVHNFIILFNFVVFKNETHILINLST